MDLSGDRALEAHRGGVPLPSGGVSAVAVQVCHLREQHGLTQAELAERCGLHQADISRIERGTKSPTTRTLQRIADALGADLLLVTRR